MKKLLIVAAILFLASIPASAQVTVPHTLADGETIDAARLNNNFSSIFGDAFNRTGGVMTGTATMLDIAAVTNNNYDIGTSGTRFRSLYIGTSITTSTLTVEGTGASAIDVAGGVNAGSGNVGIIGTDGRVPSISSTYFASLDGTALTGVAMLGSTNTFTARNDFKTYTELKSTANPSGGAITYDLSTGTHFETALTGDATVTISNVPNPSNGVVAFTVKFTADGTARTFTWPGSVVWAGGIAIDFTDTNNKRDVVTFISWDAGTTWFAFIGGQNF